MTTRSRCLAFALVCAAPTFAVAQQPDFRWEKALPAGSTVSAHNLNGDVTVTPSTSGKVEVVGRKRGNSRYFDEVSLEVVQTSRGVMICSMFRGVDMDCDEDGFHMNGRRGHRDRDFDDVSIDIDVKLPKGMVIEANSVSGNVSVVGAEGSVRAGSVSGDVRMEQLRATGVRASSVSGNVTVSIESLTGDGALRFTSVSGNVTAELPKGIDADVTMRTVSGSMDSDFPLTLNGRVRRNSLEARIGRGGRDLDVTTVSGNVRLRSAK
jgi:hypothetical protein